jgi:hypothetical protein
VYCQYLITITHLISDLSSIAIFDFKFSRYSFEKKLNSAKITIFLPQGRTLSDSTLDIYELNGAVGIYGPNGVIACNSAALTGPAAGTKLKQFEGILDLGT